MHFNPNTALKIALLKRGITQRFVAFSIGINENKMSNIIRGYKKPSKEVKAKISTFLKVKSQEIFPEP